jgi:exodeoxyribonuclease VII large subunit
MQPIFSVSEFHEMVNLHLALLGEIVIEGEISELKPSGTQWLYITINDASSTLKVFATQFHISNWRSLEVGMRVHVYGTPRTYAPYGTFSLSASRIVPAGEGALKIAFEKLKSQLEKEGLFDESRKRPLPAFPKNIGLITARNSQAYNDFVKVLQNRMGGLHIFFAPVQVQGDAAAPLICQAIQFFNKHMSHLDALVICRGGGSLEDLQAFNDEAVARAIFASHIPVVCGVGHEGDFSLADLVADVRASTPSNAAELLVREREAMLHKAEALLLRLDRAYRAELTERKHTVFHALTRLEHALHTSIQSMDHRIDAFYATVPTLRLHIQHSRSRLSSLQRLLSTLDSDSILAKGYSITRGIDGALIRSIEQTIPGQSLSTRVADGTIYSHVQKTSHTEVDN